ncbi:para-aminobenzoate N-oxygenase AurF [Arcicella aurantiaca]|uniref:Para-aminobenzoate N-oxygenase AurF n=1 Tax=Arcicella aurantiaca TaxID=591202 RepID=A0A316DJE4_9BACT|nr:diiron oxygenase [Arcicella aurantiaca]PWK17612.1 para-aminobenzoate N-oxygenase AurF [Arcicella aurantiaca]
MIQEKELSEKFTKLLQKLNDASDKKQMSMLLDHPWHSPNEGIWLKKRENLSIYGTEFYDYATEEERQRLSIMETATWWHTFVVFENLVTEYYLKIINHESLKAFPEVVRYMHHFCREEVTHALVFRKAMKHFNIPPFPVPDNLKDFYKDNASIIEFPLKAIFLTILMEWFAENNAMLDCNNDFVSPLSRAIAVEHHKEEARHIEWGKLMMREFIEVVPDFLDDAREYTAPFMRNLLDMATCNPETYDRVGFTHPAFQDYERLFETVLFSENRKQINRKIMEPLIRFFIEIEVYTPDYHEIWEAARFGEDIEFVLEKERRKIVENDNLLEIPISHV